MKMSPSMVKMEGPLGGLLSPREVLERTPMDNTGMMMMRIRRWRALKMSQWTSMLGQVKTVTLRLKEAKRNLLAKLLKSLRR